MAETSINQARPSMINSAPRTRRAIFTREFLKNKGAVVGVALLVVIVLAAFMAPWIAPYDPFVISSQDLLAAPSQKHWMGADQYGRDTLSRILHGARISLQVGFLANAFSAAVGMLVGVTAGYYGGRYDTLAMGLMDMIFAFPALLLALTIIALVGERSLSWVMLALGIVSIPMYARLIRGSVLSAKENAYVEAAKVLGLSSTRIMWRHILPNTVSPVIVVGTLMIGVAIRAAAGLSFLGLGAQPPTPEWGLMLYESKQFMRVAPWGTVFPGIAIVLTVLAFNLVGDGLRTALDPRMKVD